MFVLEYKVKAKEKQYRAIDDAIRTSQFVRNKALRYWLDNQGVNKYDLNKYCRILAKEFSFADELNSSARQASAERAWSGISRFFENCKKQISGKKGFPKFKKNTRSVEYKQSGWRLDNSTKKHITFTDKKGIGRLKLVGSRDIYFYNSDIKRVRLVRRADGYYLQFCISVEVRQELEPTGKAIGLDVGLKFLYVDNFGHTEENPKFYRQSEKRLKKLQERVSRKFKKRTAHGEETLPCGRSKKGHPVSKNYLKAVNRLARLHLKVSRQREEHSKKLARCVVTSNDVVAYEDLQIKNLVKNHHLAKSINDAGWYQLRKWLEYFGVKFGKITIAVPPQWTSQQCSSCGKIVKKTLSTRTHQCSCGLTLCRDENASRNVLQKALATVGHTGSWLENSLNALGEDTATLVGVIQSEQVTS